MPTMSPAHARTTVRFAEEATAALAAIDLIDRASWRVAYDFTQTAAERIDTMTRLNRARRHLECTPRAFTNWAQGMAEIELRIAAKETER